MKREKKLIDGTVAALRETYDAEEQTRYRWWQLLIPPSLLTLLTIVFYYPSLGYPFQFDDLANITKKFDIRVMQSNLWLTTSRWVGEVINRLNYQLGKFDPWYYRSVNLGIHIIGGLLVFGLFYALCRKTRKESFLNQNALSIASITAGLFLLHPVQTQTVSYVIQARLEGLASICVLGAIYLFITAFSTRSMLLRFALLTLTLMVAIVSCGTKEIVVVAPFLLMLADWFFLAQEEWSSFKSRIWFHLLFTAVIFAGLLYYLKPSFFTSVLGLQVTTPCNRGNIITEKATDIIKPLHYLISEFKVVLHYMAIFIWPLSLSVEYDWRLSPSFFSPDSFFPFLILVAMLAFALNSMYHKKNNYIAFAILWFLISVAPRSTIIPSPELICDYKSYLASAGWLFAIAAGIVYLTNYLVSLPALSLLHRIPTLQLHALTLLALSVGLGTASMNRNMVWKSAEAFWRDVVEKAPTKARAYNNLGVALSEEQRFEDAIPYYLQAIKLDHFYSDPWSNIAVAYSVRGDDDKAIGALKEAIRLFPYYAEAYNNLGSLILKKKDYAAAEFFLSKAIELRPWYGKALFNSGRLHLEKGDQEKAWAFFKRATEGDMDTPEGFGALGQVSMQMKKFAEAATAFRTALKLGARDTGALFNLANASYLSGDIVAARDLFKALVTKHPEDARFAYNYAESLYSNKEYTESFAHFKRIGSQVKELSQAHIRAANSLEQLGDFEQAASYLSEVLKNKPDKNIEVTAKNELNRIMLQTKIKDNKGTVNMSDINKYINSLAVTST